MRVILYLICLFIFISCQKEVSSGYVERPFSESKRSIESYEDAFVTNVGEYYPGNLWGNWILTPFKKTRNIGHFEPVDVSEKDINYVLNLLRNEYDGINALTIPGGDYYVKIIYRNDYIYYNTQDYLVDWFKSTEKIGDIKKYRHSNYKFETININDSTYTLINNIEEYDGVIPQFAYFNELFNENHFEHITLEKNGIYYVGFDFYADGYIELDGNNKLFVVNQRDYIYNDIVIILVPAIRYGTEEVLDEKRVICEDMCDYDFDFNDLVFDVALVNVDNKIKTRIKLISVGTVYPMSIYEHEAHAEFGEQEGIMINSLGLEVGVNRDPAYIYVDSIISDIRDIQVASFKDRTLLMITAYHNEAPRKICVQKDFKYCSGKCKISDVYPRFTEWLKDYSIKWEEKYDERLVSK